VFFLQNKKAHRGGKWVKNLAIAASMGFLVISFSGRYFRGTKRCRRPAKRY
jgi:hypothetical protein